MANVYGEIDKSVLPDEYLPDDYTGPSAGPLSQILGETNCSHLRNHWLLLSQGRPSKLAYVQSIPFAFKQN